MTRRKPTPVTPIMKHLSPDEQKVLLMARRHRAEYWRRRKRINSVSHNAKHALLIAACAIGLVTGSASVFAAEKPAGTSAPALFNEANADQRAGRLGPAILGYERARMLAPRDEAIAQNLQTAREKAGVTAPAVAAWQQPIHWLGFDLLAILASISLLLLCLLVFGTRLIPTTLRGLSRMAGSSLAAVFIIAVSIIGLRWPELNRAIVIGTNSVAHIAPADSAATSFALKSGELVRADKTYGKFTLVRTPDGRSGWIASADVDRIIPPTA